MTLSLMVTATGHWQTGCRIHAADRDYMFVIVISMRRMQMTIVQIVYMILVMDNQVATLPTMHMCMVNMGRMLHNGFPLNNERAAIFFLCFQHTPSTKWFSKSCVMLRREGVERSGKRSGFSSGMRVDFAQLSFSLLSTATGGKLDIATALPGLDPHLPKRQTFDRVHIIDYSRRYFSWNQCR